MYSCDFPKIFKNNQTQLIQNHDAVKNDLILLLYSDKGTLFGDPNFGTSMYKTIFENASNKLYELVREDLFSVIITYMPSIHVKREDIFVTEEKGLLKCTIGCTYNDTGEWDLFDIALTAVGLVES